MEGRETYASDWLLQNYDSKPLSENGTVRRPWLQWKLALPWLLAGIFGLTTGVLGLREIRQSRSHPPGFNTELDSARQVIEFEQRKMKSSDDHLFVGQPRPEVDNAWRNLLQGLNINLDATEIGQFSKDTFSWPQDGKYFAGVQVYHALHCLNRLREFMHLPYYNQTGVAKESYTYNHMDHCINYLRHTIQCHADLTPMLWLEKPLGPSDYDNNTIQSLATSGLALSMESTYTCRKWDSIHDWASERQFDYRDRKDLVQGGGHMWVLD